VTAAVLGRLQGGLEQLYRVATGLPVEAFLIDDAARATLGLARAPREQLVVVESDDGIDVGLFVDGAVLANLAAYDPGSGLDDRNLPAFLYALEGVSHFVYAAVCAQRARAVSALELELQAEVDKYVTCLSVRRPRAGGQRRVAPSALRRVQLRARPRRRRARSLPGRQRQRPSLRRRPRAALRRPRPDRRHAGRAAPVLPATDRRQARRHRPRRVRPVSPRGCGP
jgi:hypothetical protein